MSEGVLFSIIYNLLQFFPIDRRFASSTETLPSDTRGSASGMTLHVQYRMRFSSANSALTSSSLGRKASRSASSRVRSAFSAMRCSLSRGDASPSDFKSPEQLYLDKEKLLALYDAMNRSSLRDAAWVRHRFGFDGEPCALAAAARKRLHDPNFVV